MNYQLCKTQYLMRELITPGQFRANSSKWFNKFKKAETKKYKDYLYGKEKVLLIVMFSSLPNVWSFWQVQKNNPPVVLYIVTQNVIFKTLTLLQIDFEKASVYLAFSYVTTLKLQGLKEISIKNLVFADCKMLSLDWKSLHRHKDNPD